MAATVIYTIVAAWTLIEIHSGSSDTHALAEAAKTQAEKMGTMSDAADKIKQAAEGMVTQEQRVADNAKSSLEASNKNSKAVLDSAIAASRLEQRPWVYGVHFELSAEPEKDKDVWITGYLSNSGKTPALEARTATQVFWWHAEPPESNFDLLKVDIRNMIPPGNVVSEESEHERMNERQIAAYQANRSKLYFRMKVYYRDIFQQWHWTTVCMVHTYKQPLNSFTLCDHGNDVGEGQPPNH